MLKLTLLKLGGLFVGALSILVIIIFCIASGDWRLRLLALIGAVAGWLIGMLMAPFSEEEARRFGDTAKIVYGFVTGYLLSKLDPIISAMLQVDPVTGRAPISEAPTSEQVLVTLGSFGVSLLMVFNARAYWSGDGDAPKNAPTNAEAPTPTGIGDANQPEAVSAS